MHLPKLIIFISGGGSNAKAIIEYAQQKQCYTIAAVVSNNAGSSLLPYCQALGIPTLVITNAQLNTLSFVHEIQAYSPQLIILAGFLRKIPLLLIQAFEGKILNIHPALLPKYGGKGMYGMYIHEAVIAAGEVQSGLTIHVVNAEYDEGAILHQATVEVVAGEEPNTLAAKILVLEHYYYCRIIEQYLKDL
jgi:phosphoribosylglycinamide formyltransferase 1